ncbi:hypothetical protein CQW23_29137 [Capsicum baccatum]|uniref:Cyclin-dependent kinase inhibitor n=1 Tax=Capsicum baccatum TaxID=33114 RepID=A0A2G2VIJ7_CAPBA|nr:hypothetical protein CQW23_29137 [Capsicum baccatum]
MGKYMRKSSKKPEVGVLDVSPLGVCTRAKVKQLQNSNSAAVAGVDVDGGGYMQLRSTRRLEKPKPFVGFERKRRKCPLKDQEGHSWNSGDEKKEEIQEKMNEININGGDGGDDAGVEASCGENLMEFERAARETTPSSLIRNPDSVRTPPGSSNRRNYAEANGRVPFAAGRDIPPTTRDMNDFFAGPEEKQQREFIEKYNFDPVNEKPLPGRYEWVKIDP